MRQNGRRSAKQAVPRTAPSARTLSAYLHRRGTASGSAMGPFTVLGRASLCSLALIAAGSCERAAGSGGAKRPRSGAEGALDTAARERIMGRRGQGSEPAEGPAVSGLLARCLSCRDRGDLLHDGTGAARGQPGLPRPAGAVRARRHDDRLGVLPPAGGCGRSVYTGRPPGPARQDRERLTADWRELAAVMPHLVSSAPARRPGRPRQDGPPWGMDAGLRRR